MKQGTLRIGLAIVAALALAVGFAACGSSNKGSAGAGTTSSASGQPGAGKPAVTIGDKNFPEQFILGQLYAQALKAKGYTVNLKENIGSTEIADKALRAGQVSMYPEYIGIFNSTVAGNTTNFADVKAAYSAGKTYAEQHGFTLLNLTPFTDTDALAVKKQLAQQHGLTSVSDLKKLGTLRLGAPPEFRNRPTGLPGLAKDYGLTNVKFSPLTIGLQYQALDNGNIDVADVFTTDGQLTTGKYTVLKDPKNVFGFQNLTPVVSSKVLQQEGPEFADTLNRVSATLTTEAMQRMNQAYTVDKQPAATIAQQFLKANGLL